jgi:RNA polymerase sigma-70 factor (ECF subfamily)
LGAAGLSALHELSPRYWFPLYAFLRRRGYRTEESQDLIRGFFFRRLERGVSQKADRARGCFRSFLLAKLQNYVANESARQRTLRRGGEETLLSLEFENAEVRLINKCTEELSPEAQFHRQWVVKVLDRA